MSKPDSRGLSGLAKVLGLVVLTVGVAGLLTVLVVSWMMADLISGFGSALRDEEPASAQSSSGSPPDQKMQRFPAMDPVAGPLELVVSENGRDWLVRDQTVIAKAVGAGLPDTSSKEVGLLFLSFLAMSPPGNRPAEVRLSLREKGVEIAALACWSATCADLPETREVLAPLLAVGIRLESAYDSFADHAEYRQAYDAATKSALRYGDIDPPQPEAADRLSQRLIVTFPLVYRGPAGANGADHQIPDYEKAFRAEYAADQADFRLQISRHEGEGMVMRRCSDNSVVMDRAGDAPVLPEGWQFVGVSAHLDAAPALADRIQGRVNWGFLPDPSNDDEALIQGMAAAAEQKGAMTDPEDCYRLDFAPASDEVQIWRDFAKRYGFYWTRMVAGEAK